MRIASFFLLPLLVLFADEPLRALERAHGDHEAAAKPLDTDGVIAKSLADCVSRMEATDRLRVIIFLDSQPQDLLSREVQSRYADPMNAIKSDIKAIHKKYANLRELEAASDSERYANPALVMTQSDRDALNAALEAYESLSTVIANALRDRLLSVVPPYQQSLREYIEGFGGTVDPGLLGVNALTAEIAAGDLDRIARHEKVWRIAGDDLLQTDLDVVDDATLVNVPGGLWSHGNTGGLFDPAVIDTGSDLGHPGLMNAAGRGNYFAIYLEDARLRPEFADDETTPDDFVGHGTAVMGCVATYGTLSYPDHRGTAYGVAKAVTLKAGWRNTEGEGGSLTTDVMHIADIALYHAEDLYPLNTFWDEVDGINYSSGTELEEDEDDFSRFWDAVVSSYPDLVVTFPSGNSGPANEHYRTPACAYNSITVANVDDKNTESRSDDEYSFQSTIGPTAAGRRKPDLSAPGTSISSCNSEWEFEDDYTDRTGTSFAAPIIQGIAMDLMQAGVVDELEIKALLINTAQKNASANMRLIFDLDSDDDGWTPRYGWGYVNAQEAYYHRSDVFSGEIAVRPHPGYFRLYAGRMRDEGRAVDQQWRNRATLVWNRHATYDPAAPPTTYFALSDLDLRLYEETQGGLIDIDLAADNTHQVLIDEYADWTDVVVKVYTSSADFPSGSDTEAFALATPENFVEAEFPTEFDAHGIWPYEMEPNEEGEFTFWLDNESELASHHNIFALDLPSGWTLLEGDDPVDVESVAGEGGTSPSVTWRLRAQPTEQVVPVAVDHTHASYGESWGPHANLLWVVVRWDTIPPNPDPMTFLASPGATGHDRIAMESIQATDLHEPVEYFFEFRGSPTGGAGGSDSGWQVATDFTDTGLSPNHRYTYAVKARDSATAQNETGYSQEASAFTHARTPGAPTVHTPTPSSLDVTPDSGGNPEWTECAIWLESEAAGVGYFLNVNGASHGNVPDWASLADWGVVTATGLEPDTEYAFRVKARNGDGVETPWSDWGIGVTGAPLAPRPDIQANGSDEPIQVSANSKVRITVSLDAGDHAGDDADWWIFAETDTRILSYVHPTGWQPGLHRTAAIPLVSFGPRVVRDNSAPAAQYVVHFAVDENMDGIPDLTWEDSVTVIVTD